MADGLVMAHPRARSVRVLRAPPLGILLAIVTVIPSVATVTLAGRSIQQRWDIHESAQQVQREALTVRSLAALESAVTQEIINTGAVIAGDEFNIDATTLRQLLGFDPGAEMARARATVDDQPAPGAPVLVRDLDALRQLRRAVDAGDSSLDEVRTFQRSFRARMVSALSEELARLSVHAAAVPQAERAHGIPVDATRLLVAAFQEASSRLDLASRFIAGPVAPADVQSLVEADSRYQLAASEAKPILGPLGRASAERLRSAATTEHFDDLVADLRAGRDPGAVLDPGKGSSVAGLRDGATWLAGVSEVVEASAADVAANAAQAQRDATAALRGMVIAVTLVLILAGIITVAIVRTMMRVANRLVGVAHQIAQGDFHAGTDLSSSAGPREARAVNRAIGELSDTLVALEAYVTTLADDPTSVALDRPLPGATGQALQRTVDRLRAGLKLDEQTRARLAEAASHDALTGLLNRRGGVDAITQELGEDRRANQAGVIALLFIDLDGLKDINDRHGHAAGDAAIGHTAEALRWATRRADVVARMGGDEFVVVLHAPDAAAVDALAERIQAALTDRPLELGDASLAIHCSIGVALAEPHEGADDLLRRADEALYRAKDAGRNRIAWHQPQGSSPSGGVVVAGTGELLP